MESKTEPTVSFSLTVKDSAKALKFYSEAFGAVELFRLPSPDGGVAAKRGLQIATENGYSLPDIMVGNT